MGKSPHKKGGNKVNSPPAQVSSLDSMEFWHNLTKQLLPDADKEVRGEVAVAIYGVCKNLQTEIPQIDKICAKNADTRIKVGMAIQIDRRTDPAEVTVTISYAEKHSNKLTAQVPDPNQKELPIFNAVKTQAEGEGEGSGAPDLGAEA